MLAADNINSEVEREYFIDEFADFPVMGWAAFCRAMQDGGQGEWLEKIMHLDEEVMLNTLERRMFEAIEGKLTDGGKRSIDKETLDATVKSIQGLVGRSKILSEQRSAALANTEIIVKILESKNDSDVPGGDCEKKAIGDGDVSDA